MDPQQSEYQHQHARVFSIRNSTIRKEYDDIPFSYGDLAFSENQNEKCYTKQ